MANKQFNIGKQILGQGAFNQVYLGTMMHENQKIDVAIKRVTNEIYEDLKKEFDLLNSVQNHVNIIKLLGIEKDENFSYVIMELGDCGDLNHFLMSGEPSLEDKIRIMHGTASGLAYMHNLPTPIIHTDIKPGNIIIMKALGGVVAKVCDFGFARIFKAKDGLQGMSTKTGATSWYLALELFASDMKKYDASIDTFALGLVYLVVINFNDKDKSLDPNPTQLREGALLQYGQHMNLAKQKAKKMSELFTLSADDIWPLVELKSVVTQMTSFHPRDRIQMADVEVALRCIKQKNTTASSITTLKRENEDKTQLLLIRGEEIASLSEERDNYSKENDALKLQLRKKDDEMQQKDHLVDESEVKASQKDQRIQLLESDLASKTKTLQSNTIKLYAAEREAVSNNSKSVQTEEFVKSFRHTSVDLKLWLKPSSDISRLFSKTNIQCVNNITSQTCDRMSYVNNSIYFPCPGENSLHIYSLDGKLRKDIKLDTSPRTLHPLSEEGHLALAVESGLFVVDYDGRVVCQIMEGDFIDVHASGHVMAAIERHPIDDSFYSSENNDDIDAWADTDTSGHEDRSDRIHILSTTAPYPQSAVFSVGHYALTVLLSEDASTVWVSDYATDHVTAYSLNGGKMSQVGGHEKPGKLCWPHLCATDSSGEVLICDWWNDRLQLLSAGGELAVLPGVHVTQPRDAFIHDNNIYVLHDYDPYAISVFKV